MKRQVCLETLLVGGRSQGFLAPRFPGWCLMGEGSGVAEEGSWGSCGRCWVSQCLSHLGCFLFISLGPFTQWQQRLS